MGPWGQGTGHPPGVMSSVPRRTYLRPLSDDVVGGRCQEAVMKPDASSLFQYVECQRIPMGPDLAPRRMKPFRASRFKSSFNPSCKQTLSRGLGIRHL